MKALNDSIDITFEYLQGGYGYYQMKAHVSYDDCCDGKHINHKTFSITTNDTEWVDNYNDKKSDGFTYEELQQMYHDKFMDSFVDDIIMWMYENEFGEPFDSGKEID